MWLLHTTEFRLQEFEERSTPKYAILSHTWGEEELSFQDVISGNYKSLAGFHKVRGSCEAVRRKYEWIWIDTCCIDKNSSSQLSQAINSMHSWYENSDVCYVYLVDFEYDKQMKFPGLEKCKWFTRGWTLQELLAPSSVIFWDKNWRPLGEKKALSLDIPRITGIPWEVLCGITTVMDCSVAQRMSWASSRETTRSEDIAYCLLGLFDVHMAPIYGEGSYKAFIRLQEEILKRWKDHSLFVWTPQHDLRNVGLLASSPRPFCRHQGCFSWLTTELTRHGVTLDDLSSFDPYDYMYPLGASPQSVNVDPGLDNRVNTHLLFKNTIGSTNSVTPRLGPEGLQISLLASKELCSIEGATLAEVYGFRPVICLDLVLATKRRVLCNILLPLSIDFYGSSFGFPSRNMNRRGLLSRRPPVEPENQSYLFDSQSHSFVRQTLCISQLEPLDRSIECGKFEFDFHTGRTSIPTGLILDIGNDMIMVYNTTSDVQELAKFSALGGSLAFRHRSPGMGPCGKSHVELIVDFGLHGTKPRPWCYISVSLDPNAVIRPSLERYRIYETHSSRYSSNASRPLPCGHVVSMEMIRVTGNLWLMELAIRDDPSMKKVGQVEA